MNQAHLSLEGQWQDCAEAACELKFHVPGMSAAEVQQLPSVALNLVLESVDPPTSVDADGTKEWRDEDKRLHRDYGLPAVDGPQARRWFRHGEFHRVNGPAVDGPDGFEAWYQDDVPHRENGPALVVPGQYTTWSLHGQRHRDGDLPAHIASDGEQSWYQHGRLHRGNGKPALIHADGEPDYYWRGHLMMRHELQLHRLVAFVQRVFGRNNR